MEQHLCEIEIFKNCIILIGPYNTFIYSAYDKGRQPKVIDGYLRRK